MHMPEQFASQQKQQVFAIITVVCIFCAAVLEKLFVILFLHNYNNLFFYKSCIEKQAFVCMETHFGYFLRDYW